MGGCIGGCENSEQTVGQAEDPTLAGSACSVRAEGVETGYSIVAKVGLGKGLHILIMQEQGVCSAVCFSLVKGSEHPGK